MQASLTTDQSDNQCSIDPLEIYKADQVASDMSRPVMARKFEEARHVMKQQIASYLMEMLTMARSPAIHKTRRVHRLAVIIESRAFEDCSHSLEVYQRCSNNRKKWRRYINDLLHQVRARRKIEASGVMNFNSGRPIVASCIMRRDDDSADYARRNSVTSIGSFVCDDLLSSYCTDDDGR